MASGANQLYVELASLVSDILEDFGEDVYIERSVPYNPAADAQQTSMGLPVTQTPVGAVRKAVKYEVDKRLVDGEKYLSTDFLLIFAASGLAFEVSVDDWVRMGGAITSTPRHRIVDVQKVESVTTEMAYVVRCRL